MTNVKQLSQIEAQRLYDELSNMVWNFQGSDKSESQKTAIQSAIKTLETLKK